MARWTLTNGSTNNRIYNNTVDNKFNYGININSTGNLFYDNYAAGVPVSLLQRGGRASKNTLPMGIHARTTPDAAS